MSSSSFKLGYLQTNSNQLESGQGSLIESKNVLNVNGVVRPRPGLELITGDVLPVTWNGREYPESTNESTAFRVLKMIPHAGSIYAVGIIGAPSGQSYTEAEADDGYCVLKLDEDAEYSIWGDPSEYEAASDISRVAVSAMGWRISKHAFSYFMALDGRQEILPSMVSGKNELLITTSRGVISTPVMPSGQDEALSLNGKYVIPNSRVFSTDPTAAGCPDAASGALSISASTIGFAIPPEAAVAYRYAWGKKMPNGVEVLGWPSGRMLIRNPSTTDSKDITHLIPIPLQILEAEQYEQSQYFLRILRTKKALISEAGEYNYPNETYYALDDIYPTSAEFAAGTVGYQDILAMESSGAELKISSSSLLGIGAAPPDCRVAGAVGDVCLYGDVSMPWRMSVSILAVDDVASVANSGIVPGAAADGDIIVVGPYAFMVEDATNTTVAYPNPLERLSIPTDGIYAGVAGASERVKSLTKTLIERVNVIISRAYNAYFTPEQVRLLTSGIHLEPEHGDQDLYSTISISCWKDPNPSDGYAGRYGYRPIVGISRYGEAPTISPFPTIDGTDGRSIKIIGSTGGGSLETSEPHGLSVGDEVHLAFNPGYWAKAVSVGATYPAPFLPGVRKVLAVSSSIRFSVDGIFAPSMTCPVVVSGTGILFLGAVTKVKRQSDGAVHSAMASRDVVPGAVFSSLPGKFQSVPLANYQVLGDPGAAVLAIQEIAGVGFVFKEDGVWRVDVGSITGLLSPSLFDDTLILVAPNAVCQLGGYIYAWTTKGVVRISEGGAEMISQQIDDLLDKARADAPDSNRLFAHAFAHKEQGMVYLWLSESDSPESGEAYANVCYVFDGVGWQKHQIPAATACMTPANASYAPFPTMALAIPYMANGIYVERKDTDSDDIADEKLPLTSITKTGPKGLTAYVGAYISSLHNDGPSQWPQGVPWASDPWFTDKTASGSPMLIVNGTERLACDSVSFNKSLTGQDWCNRVTIQTSQNLPNTVTSATLVFGYESKVLSVASEFDALGQTKHFQDVSFCFSRPFFTTAKVYFFSDSGSDIVEVAMPGSYSSASVPSPTASLLTPGFRKHIRQYVPREHRRASALCVGFSNDVAMETFGVSSVTVVSDDVGGPVTRKGE